MFENEVCKRVTKNTFLGIYRTSSLNSRHFIIKEISKCPSPEKKNWLTPIALLIPPSKKSLWSNWCKIRLICWIGILKRRKKKEKLKYKHASLKIKKSFLGYFHLIILLEGNFFKKNLSFLVNTVYILNCLPHTTLWAKTKKKKKL